MNRAELRQAWADRDERYSAQAAKGVHLDRATVLAVRAARMREAAAIRQGGQLYRDAMRWEAP